MIRSRLREVAAKSDINNGYQFQKLTGFPIANAYALWRDDWKAVNLRTLNKLCTLFECTPNDLLEFEPDENDQF